MSTIRWATKAPAEVLDYGHDWSPRMPSDDGIASTTAAVTSGAVTIDAHAVGDAAGVPEGKATVTWLSAGTPGTSPKILLTAITTQGRKLQETITVPVSKA